MLAIVIALALACSQSHFLPTFTALLDPRARRKPIAVRRFLLASSVGVYRLVACLCACGRHGQLLPCRNNLGSGVPSRPIRANGKPRQQQLHGSLVGSVRCSCVMSCVLMLYLPWRSLGGRYGSAGSTTNLCSGAVPSPFLCLILLMGCFRSLVVCEQCSAGYRCAAGSTNNMQANCGLGEPCFPLTLRRVCTADSQCVLPIALLPAHRRLVFCVSVAASQATTVPRYVDPSSLLPFTQPNCVQLCRLLWACREALLARAALLEPMATQPTWSMRRAPARAL